MVEYYKQGPQEHIQTTLKPTRKAFRPFWKVYDKHSTGARCMFPLGLGPFLAREGGGGVPFPTTSLEGYISKPPHNTVCFW